MAVGLAIFTDLRDRRSRRGRVQGGRIDASKAEALIVSPAFGRSVSEYLPPPDDGRPQH
jgi:hypothetical protein